MAGSMLGPWNSLGDPTRGGTKDLRETTFESQASFVLPLPGMPGASEYRLRGAHQTAPNATKQLLIRFNKHVVNTLIMSVLRLSSA